MTDLNRIFLTGRLVADPDVKYTPSGAQIAKFRIAVNRSYRKKDSNEWIQESFFVTIVTWNKLAERVEKSFKKGDLVIVEGRLNIRSYEAEGVKKWVTDITANNVSFLPRNRPRDDVKENHKEVSGDSDIEVPFS
ncbi:MAG: single-stranded DNA-binding protein [Caldisericota bacterium]|nr:single-stranded DNA-binding protein [Caldisericota bacterium]